MNKLLYLKDRCRSNDHVNLSISGLDCIYSQIRFINDQTGEEIFKPLHNRTVIAGAGLTLQKLFGLDRSCLDNTPTYDQVLALDDGASDAAYPTIGITDADGNIVGSIPDEGQRSILGFCLGMGGSGVETTNVFTERYASWITPDTLVPFRYPLESADDVDESIYKGKKTISLSSGQTRCAYYFKEFSNTPQLVQNYVSSIETFIDSITPATVYDTNSIADHAQSFVELHCKVTSKDCREFFIAHSGLEQAKINQISLVYGWKKTIQRTKFNTSGTMITQEYDVYQQVRPFSICNFPTELLSDKDKSISIIYTLYC